ncbi:MAG TPA: MMPL family transporter [Thermomicrobiales bacterium]
MELSTARLARFCARRGRLVVAGWLVALVAIGVGAAAFGGDLTNDDAFVGKPESVRGDDLVQQRMPSDQTDSEVVIVRSAVLTVDDPGFRQTVEAIVTDLRGMTGTVREAPTYYDAVAAGDQRAPLLVSPDRRTTLIPVTLEGNDEAFPDRIAQLASRTTGYEVLTIGDVSIDAAENRLVTRDLIRSDVVGLPAALVVLVIVFGALVAAGVPISLAVVSILGAVGLTVLLSRLTEMSVYALNMITLIGLAVGVDYALFVVDRYREERRHGRPPQEAIALAGGTAGRAVLFSGGTVAIALLGMFLLPTTLFRSLGAGAILAVVVAVLATLTLIPALLGLLGDRIEWPRRRKGGRRKAEGGEDRGNREQGTGNRGRSAFRLPPSASPSQPATGFWGQLTQLVMARPVVSVLIASGLLIAAAVPYVDLRRGTAGAESLPAGDVKQAYQILRSEFAAGLVEPVEIVVDAKRGPESEAAIDRLVVALGQDGSFGPVTARQWNAGGTLGVVEVPLTADGNSPAADETVARLRHDLIPRAFAGVDAAVYVAGDPAANADLNLLIARWTPRVFALVLGLSFLLLLLAFRSLVVPIKAIAMNLLSVGAAYGLLVLVFQKGYLHGFFGFEQTPTIEAWLPIFLFCILFGLSMDYHVFLLSRIREHYDRTGNNREAVAVGLRSTARIITGAASIMVVVFGAFASGEIVFFQQLGFGLAVAILVDATIVRLVLVPASMALLGDRNWYLPRWLGWLPDLHVEGTPTLPRTVPPEAAPGD